MRVRARACVYVGGVCACVYTVYGLRPYVRTFISSHMFAAADGVGGRVVKMLMT